MCNGIVKFGKAGGVLGGALGHEDDHALPGAGQEDSVGVEEVLLIDSDIVCFPRRTRKLAVVPTVAVSAKVGVPADATPIEF